MPVTLSSGLENIDIMAFYACTNLARVIIPDKVARIGNQAFSSCLALSELTLSYGLNSIGQGAFNGCSIQDLRIPDSVTSIGSVAF